MKAKRPEANSYETRTEIGTFNFLDSYLLVTKAWKFLIIRMNSRIAVDFVLAGASHLVKTFASGH